MMAAEPNPNVGTASAASGTPGDRSEVGTRRHSADIQAGARPRTARAIDSHTGGEPTRVIVEGGPELGGGTMARQLAVFEAQHDRFRAAVVNEPRGSDVLVGALLCKPHDESCSAGVIFFNNVGALGMCGHGTIGLIVTLAYLWKVTPGLVRIDTPVGVVEADWRGGAEVAVANVPSYRSAKGVRVETAKLGVVEGDVAWGGNWFFLVKYAGAFGRADVERLTGEAWAIRRALNAQGFPEVDHVEFFCESETGKGDSKNFVLCPGGAYDRSPCGTGTSAKLACLAADGLLSEDTEWAQESIVGSVFRGSYRWLDREKGIIAPTITGSAYVTADATLLLDERDPFCWGLQ